MLVFAYRDGAIVDGDDAQELMEHAKALTAIPLPTLILARDVRRVTREARACFASRRSNPHASKVAIVVESSLSRVIANFFMGLNRPEFPTRLFNDEQEAREWLAS